MIRGVGGEAGQGEGWGKHVFAEACVRVFRVERLKSSAYRGLMAPAGVAGSGTGAGPFPVDATGGAAID
jgi:hypothetical protein